LYDTVRGATEALVSNSTLAESTRSEGLTSFDADGFTVGSQLGENELNTTFASWNWKAGGTAVSNTDGSITSQVSANVDAGFSIVSWTASGADATIGHGLSVQPSMIIAKRRDSTGNWAVQIPSIGTGYLLLNSTDAYSGGDPSIWNATAPTSTVFSTAGQSSEFFNAGTFIAYCFANSDIIKAGSYTGNGSADGPFIYTGFRPAWIMIKNLASGENWQIHDSGRDPDNVVTQRLYANTTGADVTSTFMDFVSNGVKCRNFSGGFNSSGATFIYLAFAETPFKYANAR
jgi:hypothetical protein